MYTPEIINSLKPNEVFVFGSNEAGIHGAGAAKIAHLKFGARFREGVGHYGNSYAIPTKDNSIETLPVSEIQKYVDAFVSYARERPYLNFLVTKIGCGLAGYTVNDIAPLFENARNISNIVLPKEFS